MLAQTCSAIGNDATPNPKLLANIEKSTKRDKISPLSSTNGGSPSEFKSSFKPYESSLKESDAPDDLRVASRLKAAGKLHNGNERCESTQSSSSQHTRKSPPSASPKIIDHKSISNSSASAKSTTPTQEVPTSQPQKSDKETTAAALRSMPTGPYPMPYLNSYPYGYNPMELLAQHQSMLKAAALSNPYLNYAARMKAAGAEMMMGGGICRDPYCTGCNLSSHLMGKNGGTPSCPPGCTCDHSISKAMAANPAAAMAYHAQLAQLAAASQLPYV